MRGVSGAIVVLAGSVLVGTSMVADELARHGNHFAGAPVAIAAVGGLVLIIGGLLFAVADVFASLFPAGRPSEPSSTDIRPALRP